MKTKKITISRTFEITDKGLRLDGHKSPEIFKKIKKQYEIILQSLLEREDVLQVLKAQTNIYFVQKNWDLKECIPGSFIIYESYIDSNTLPEEVCKKIVETQKDYDKNTKQQIIPKVHKRASSRGKLDIM